MSPPLSLDQCAALYESMLADVLNATQKFAEKLELIPVLSFHPPAAAGELLSRTPPGFRLQPQRGADLGERMANAFAEAAAAGAERVLLRGSDSPGLDYLLLESALCRLDAGDDLVFVPDQGGGYAAVGMRTYHKEIFTVPMSTEDMMARTLCRARELGLRTSLTSPTFDLDTVGDFRFLNALSSAQQLDLCPLTVESISALPAGLVL